MYKEISGELKKSGKMPEIRPSTAMRTLQIAIAGLAWIALLLQLYLMIVNGTPGAAAVLERIGHYFSFFTILTNILVALTLTVPLLFPRSKPGRFFSSSQAQTGTAVYIAIVGATYSLLLRHLWSPVGPQKLADVLLHDVIPIIYLVYWRIFVSKGVLRWKDAGRWLIYPLVYMVYTLVHGAITGWYPYPFVDAAVIGLPRALLHGGLFLLVFWLIGLLAVAIGRWMSRRGAGRVA